MNSITDKSQMIDSKAIKKCCEKIKNIATDFEKSAKNIKSASNMCTEDVLSVDGLTFQPTLGELSELIKSVKGRVDEFVDSIDDVSVQIYNKQKRELEEYKREQKRKKDKK